MAWLSVPRPSGSAAERRTRDLLAGWLAARGVPHARQRFRLHYASNELIGAWLLGSLALLVLTTALRLPWPALAASALAVAAVVANVAAGWPLAVWMLACDGENIVATVEPRGAAERELVVAAHYDTKTELFDHTVQGRLFAWLPRCIGLAALAIAVGALDRALLADGSPWSLAARAAGLLLLAPVVPVVGAVGLNLLPGRLIAQSQGAVDNGAACATVLLLAARLAGGARPERTRVTLALFGGEEVSMQGSAAYVAARAWPLPAAAVNLELMGQRGPFVIWQREGNVLVSAPTDPALSAEVAAAVERVAGRPPAAAGGINSDGYSFVRAGVPTCVLGTYDPRQGGGGLHRPTDEIGRVDLGRVEEGVRVLLDLVAARDAR